VAPGHYIISTYLNGEYLVWGGTSMSTPHVAGVLALLIAKYGHLPVGNFGDLTSFTLRGLLHLLAADLSVPGWDQATGYGLVQFA
jgi:subtilisin family serine protease